MTQQALIAGGGIGGLAAALAISRAGWQVELVEQSASFSEVGAGVQLGPNVVRRLNHWGLEKALQKFASWPQALSVHSAISGEKLAGLTLGNTIHQRYGAPYATLHRADLHSLLRQAVEVSGSVRFNLNEPVSSFNDLLNGVMLKTLNGTELRGDFLVGADGLWSRVRQQLLGDGLPRFSGHLAYRALIPQQSLIESLRSHNVTVWLGPKLHVVQYPVRCGEYLNLVVIVHGQLQGEIENNLQSWDLNSNATDVQQALSGTCTALQDLISSVPGWRRWALCDRPALRSPAEQAHGLVALLGDASHPMRPYLAQGAGMAIEDADCFGRLLGSFKPTGQSLPQLRNLLQAYALERWQRNARVQNKAARNGRIFHLEGLSAWARDATLKLLGQRLIDLPWLYRG